MTKVVRQHDKLFINLLNKFRVGNIDDDVEKSLKTRFIYESDENSPKGALHMYAVKGLAVKRNEAVLHDLCDALCAIEINGKTPDNFNNSWCSKSKANQQSLAKLLKLKVDAKVVLRIDLDVQDCLINVQTGNNRHTEFAQGSGRKEYVKLSH